MNMCIMIIQDHWRYDPFEAYMDSNGDIFARGTQDMKSIGIQLEISKYG